MIVGFIPARGGSKRLPRKNIRLFAGKPLLAYTIEQARAARGVDCCVVSTDDDEIAGIAREYGALVVRRPPELSTDFSPTSAAAQHVLRELQGHSPEALLTLQPNCPLRPPGLLEEAIHLFRTAQPDSVITVTKTAEKCGLLADGRFVPEYRPGTRSQDLPDRYFENGVLYLSRASLVLEAGDLFGSHIVPLVIDSLYARGDIDTQLDFDIAEFLFQRYRDRFAGAPVLQEGTRL